MKKIKDLRFMELYAWVMIPLMIGVGLWLLTRPCIFHPFSNHSAWEWGYRDATGHWPDPNIVP